MKKFFVGMSILFVMGCGTISEHYVAADRKTFEALEPIVRKLDKDVDDLLNSWEARIEAAEEGKFEGEE